MKTVDKCRQKCRHYSESPQTLIKTSVHSENFTNMREGGGFIPLIPYIRTNFGDFTLW